MLEGTVCKNNALLVVCELLLGPKRFSDLCADLPSISTNVLSQRSKNMEDIGVVVREELPRRGEKGRDGLEQQRRLNNVVMRGVRQDGQTIHAFAGISLNVAILIAVFWLRRSSV